MRTAFIALAEHSRALVGVDQPASIGALAVAVARTRGIDVAYRPDPAMRRIADAPRTTQHTLHRVGTDDETLAEPSALAGNDDDLARQSTRLTNRLRDALLPVHPALERLLAPRLDRADHQDLLATAPTPTALRELGADGTAATMRPRAPRLARTLPETVKAALDSQTLVVPATAAFAREIAGVPGHLRDVYAERADLPVELEARLEAHRVGTVPTSVPGLGGRTDIMILTIVGYGSAFPTAGDLAGYARLAPVTRRSGILYAMLRERTPYTPPTVTEPDPALAAA